MPERDHSELHWWQTRWFVLAMAAVAIVPLLWPTIPPLVDLPGHMGRYRVQLSLGEYPWLSDWYNFSWQLIGNLGIDILVVPLASIFGLELAVKLIVITIPLLTVTGFLWIAREVHGRIPPTALFALPLAYSFPFQFGFVNFALAMAIALNAFALWLRLGRTGHFRLRTAIFVPLSCALWVCHTFGWGVLGVLAFSAEMIRCHDARTDRGPLSWVKSWVRAGLGCLPLTLPLLLMIVWRSGQHVGGETGDWFNWTAKLHWVEMVLRDRWQLFDYVSLGIMGGVLLLGLVLRPLQYSRNLALSALFLATVYVLLPRIVFGSAYADMWLAPFVIAIALIAVRPRPGLSWRGSATLAAIGLAFFLVRIGGQTVSYWRFFAGLRPRAEGAGSCAGRCAARHLRRHAGRQRTLRSAVVDVAARAFPRARAGTQARLCERPVVDGGRAIVDRPIYRCAPLRARSVADRDQRAMSARMVAADQPRDGALSAAGVRLCLAGAPAGLRPEIQCRAHRNMARREQRRVSCRP